MNTNIILQRNIAEIFLRLSKEGETKEIDQLVHLLDHEKDSVQFFPVNYLANFEYCIKKKINSPDELSSIVNCLGKILNHPSNTIKSDVNKILSLLLMIVNTSNKNKTSFLALNILLSNPEGIKLMNTNNVSDEELIFALNTFDETGRHLVIGFIQKLIDAKSKIDETKFPIFFDNVCNFLISRNDPIIYEEISWILYQWTMYYSNIKFLKTSVPKICDAIQKICSYIDVINSKRIRYKSCIYWLIYILIVFSKTDILAKKIIKNELLDLPSICFHFETNSPSSQIIISFILDLILCLLPATRHASSLPESTNVFFRRELKRSRDFAIKIQPFILKLFYQRNRSYEKKILVALASTISVKIPENLHNLLIYLRFYALNLGNKKEVFFVIQNLLDSNVSLSQLDSVLSIFEEKYNNEAEKEFFDKEIINLKNRSNYFVIKENIGKYYNNKDNQFKLDKRSDMNGFITFINKLNSFEYGRNQNNENINVFFRDHFQEIQKLANKGKILDKLKTLCLDFLTFYNFPEIKNPFPEICSPADFLSMNVELTIHLTCNESPHYNFCFPLNENLIAIEAWYNHNIRKILPQNLKEAAKQNSIIGQHLFFSDNDINSWTKIGILNRVFSTRGYQKVNIFVNKKKYSVNDSIFNVFCQNIEKISEIRTSSLAVYITPLREGDEEPRREISNSFINDNFITSTVEMLSLIHKIDPKMSLISNSFVSQIVESFNIPVHALFSKSLQSSLIFQFPFLFPIEVRKLFLQMKCMDFETALNSVDQYFSYDQIHVSSYNNNGILFKVHKDKEKLFMESNKILFSLMPGCNNFQVNFLDDREEEVSNLDPTQVFFNILAKEFCLKDYDLWYKEEIEADEESKYVENENGLLLMPGKCNKSKDIMTNFGILCAQSIAMNYKLDIKINPVFFKLILGEQIREYDIIPEFETLFENKEGFLGFCFNFPGHSDIILKEGGDTIEIAESNFDEYVRLIKDFITNEKNYRPCIDCFIKGFSMVIPWNMMSIFTPNEIVEIITGEKVK